jgi:TonB family protein
MPNVTLLLVLILIFVGSFTPASSQSGDSRFQKTFNRSVAKSVPEKARSEHHVRDDIDYDKFMRDLQREIKRNWFPPKSNESRSAMVVFKVHRDDGRVSDIRITRSTGMALGDQAALKAIRSVSTKLQLPPGAPKDVDIQFTFDYNVFDKDTGKARVARTVPDPFDPTANDRQPPYDGCTYGRSN